MAKILNLDSFVTNERSVKLNGVDYPVLEMSVESFIETTRQAQKMIKEEAGILEQVEATVDMIRRSVPTLPEEIIRRMPLEHMQTVVGFIRGDHLTDGIEDSSAPAQDDEAGKKKPTSPQKRRK